MAGGDGGVLAGSAEHLVGLDEEGWRNGEAQGLGRLQ